MCGRVEFTSAATGWQAYEAARREETRRFDRRPREGVNAARGVCRQLSSASREETARAAGVGMGCDHSAASRAYAGVCEGSPW